MYQCMDPRLYSCNIGSTVDSIRQDTDQITVFNSIALPPSLDRLEQAVPSQEVDLTPSCSYASKKDLIVWDQNSNSAELPASHRQILQVTMPCEPTGNDCMHASPTQTSPEVQKLPDIEIKDNDGFMATPCTSPARHQSPETNKMSTSNDEDSIEADFPDVLSHLRSPVALLEANIICPLISLPLSLSVQKEKCLIGSQVSTGHEYEEPILYTQPASTPPTEPHKTPMRHDFPSFSPVLSKVGRDIVDTNFITIDTRDSLLAEVRHRRYDLPLHLTRTHKEEDPTLTETNHDVTNSRASMKSSVIGDGKLPDLASPNGLSNTSCSTCSISMIAPPDSLPQAQSPQHTSPAPDLFFPSKRSRTDHLYDISSDTSMRPAKRPRNPQRTPKPSPFSILHKLEHSKLSLPFRSPISPKLAPSVNGTPQGTMATEADAANTRDTIAHTPTPITGGSSFTTPKPQQVTRLNTVTTPDFRKYGGTAQSTKAVSRPFKSPFKSPLSSLSSSTKKSVLSPNIQALERKLQLLKRAVKIKAGGEDEKLQELICKWRSVGREVSWEVWSIVREQSEGNSWGIDSQKQQSGFGDLEGNWGWETGGRGHGSKWDYTTVDQDVARKEDLTDPQELLDLELGTSAMISANKATLLDLDPDFVDDARERHRAKTSRVYNELVGRPNVTSSTHSHGQDETSSSSHTLGTMLRAFGIDDDVFGWDNETEDFTIAC